MALQGYQIGQTVNTDSGQTITLTSTSDPTCFTGVDADGNIVTIRRSEIKNPIFTTYKEKMDKLGAKYTSLQEQYLEAVNNSTKFSKNIAFHSNEKENILRNAMTASKFNLNNDDRPIFDNHYDLYWENRFKLAASNSDEYNLTRASGDVLLEMRKCKNLFGLA